MRCLVTGGTGFIGLELVTKLLAEGHHVRAVSRTAAWTMLPRHPNCEWLPADMADQALDWPTLIEGCSVVFHLAWSTLPASSNQDPARDLTENVAGGLRLLDAIRRVPGIRVVFVSSGGTVYGRAGSEPIAEDSRAEPICAYGISKLAIERYLALYGELYGLDYFVLRVSNPFGAGQNMARRQGAVTTFLRCAINDLPIEIWGDGETSRDFLHVSDVGHALVIAGTLARPSETGNRVFNVGSGEGRSLNQVLQAIRSIGLPIRPIYYPARGFDVPVNILDTRRSRCELGWIPTLSFEEGVELTAKALGFAPLVKRAVLGRSLEIEAVR